MNQHRHSTLQQSLSHHQYQISDQELMVTTMDTKQLRQDFLSSDILRNFDQQKDKLLVAFWSDQLGEMIRQGFIMIMLIKFYPDKMELRQRVKSLLNEHYVKLFAKLQAPKDQIINIIIFSCCYIIHHQFFLQYPDLRTFFDLRFVYDVYHIMIHSLHGIFESDYYVKLNIDKFFSKFLTYEREKKDKSAKKIVNRQDKNFFGQVLSFPDLNTMDGGTDFSKTLHDCFKIKKRTQLLIKSNDIEAKDVNYTHRSNHLDSVTSPQAAQHTKEQLYNFQRLQFNVNSVSPAVGQILCLSSNQLRGERPKLISHKIEKLNDKDLEVWQMLRQITETKSRKKEVKGNKIVKNNLIEMHELSMPSKEYFQRHPRVDPLIKNMLELNYVLQEHPESLQQLPSSHEVKNYINDYDIIRANVGQAAKTSTAKQRIIYHLQKMDQVDEPQIDEKVQPIKRKKNFFGLEGKDVIQVSTALQSQTNQGSDGKIFLDTFHNSNSQLNPFLKQMSQTGMNKMNSPIEKLMAKTSIGFLQSISTVQDKVPPNVLESQKISQQETKRATNFQSFKLGQIQKNEMALKANQQEIKNALYEKKLEKTFRLVNQAEDGKLFIYKDKVKLYNQQYDNIMNSVSTESKINDLMQSIQIRQNLVNKQLQKKIHKM